MDVARDWGESIWFSQCEQAGDYNLSLRVASRRRSNANVMINGIFQGRVQAGGLGWQR